MKNLTIFNRHVATRRNISQQGAQTRSTGMLRPAMLRYVALKLCDRFAGALM